MSSYTREEAQNLIKRMKRHPAWYWNLLMLWLCSKGLISIRLVNKLRWKMNYE